MSPDDAVARLAADPASTALLLDFDGTLAPIVADPATSMLYPELDETLGALADAYRVVAVISGRPVEFLTDRIQSEGVLLDGLYGLSTYRDGVTRLHPDVQPWLPQVALAREFLEAEVGRHEGLSLEDKGLSVALHWRNTDDHAAAEGAATDLIAQARERTGLSEEPGKLVLELRPPVDHDKGSAVRALVAEYHPSVCGYMGDDLGDLPAFAAVAETGGVNVLVDHGNETPGRLRRAADVALPGVGAAAAFLGALAAHAAEGPDN